MSQKSKPEKKVLKRDIVEKIYQRTNGEIPKAVIHDVVTIAVDYIVNEVKEDRAVSVKYFGTFSPFRFKDRRGMNISTKKLAIVKGFNSLKFRAHSVFNSLLKKKRKKFQKKP